MVIHRIESGRDIAKRNTLYYNARIMGTEGPPKIFSSEGSYENQPPEEKARRRTMVLKKTLEILLRNQEQEESLLNKFMKLSPARADLEPVPELIKKVHEFLEGLDESVPGKSEETKALIAKLESPDLQQKMLAYVSMANRRE